MKTALFLLDTKERPMEGTSEEEGAVIGTGVDKVESNQIFSGSHMSDTEGLDNFQLTRRYAGTLRIRRSRKAGGL